jgi:rubrerythrin
MRAPADVYKQFIDFEEQAAAIYLRMASRFSPEDAELSALWLDMGMQEKQHAGLLQFCLAEELFAPKLPTNEQIQSAQSLLTRLMKAASIPDVSVEESFRIALELEGCEVNNIYDTLTTPLHASIYLLQRKIATSLPDHFEHLLKEARRFHIGEETIRGLEQLVAKGHS